MLIYRLFRFIYRIVWIIFNLTAIYRCVNWEVDCIRFDDTEACKKFGLICRNYKYHKPYLEYGDSK